MDSLPDSEYPTAKPVSNTVQSFMGGDKINFMDSEGPQQQGLDLDWVRNQNDGKDGEGNVAQWNKIWLIQTPISERM